MIRLTRRAVLATSVAGLAAPAIGRAQAATIDLGVLTPLTGAGSLDGPRMLKAMQSVADEINTEIGLLGKPIRLVVQDSETNPATALHAAHKLIDVDKVPVIMGTWSSAVTTAVAPVCWESRTFVTTTCDADGMTHLPHHGYLIRTQPNRELQATAHANFIIRHGAKRVFILSLQAPFAEPTRKILTATLASAGIPVVGSLAYDKDKTSYRPEVDAALRARPEFLYLNGAAPDVAMILRELHRAGYDGTRFCQSYALTAQSVQQLPHDVTDGVITVQPASDVTSIAWSAEARRLDTAAPDFYQSQATDWISIVALTIARAGNADGTAIRDTMRQITNSGGQLVFTATEGLKLIKAGHTIKYSGASGPCVFTPDGDITSCKFRYSRVLDGGFILIEVA